MRPIGLIQIKITFARLRARKPIKRELIIAGISRWMSWRRYNGEKIITNKFPSTSIDIFWLDHINRALLLKSGMILHVGIMS